MQKEKPSIVIISSDGRAIFARQLRNAKSLLKNGYCTKILTWDKTASKSKTENIDGCDIFNFCYTPPLEKKWGLFFTGYLLWWVYVFFYLMKDESEVYHPENLYSLIPSIPVKLLKKKIIIYDLVDFAADSFNWFETFRRFLAFFENFCLKFVEGVIVVDERKQKLKKSNIKRLAVVTNCPVDLKRNFKINKDKTDFIIYYGGLISETRGLRHICDSIKDIDQIKLIIAGFGPDELKLKSDYKYQKNVEFIGLINSFQSLEWTNKADVIFAFYDPTIRINRLASPAKLYDAMMCSKPVLVNSEALPVAETVKEENCGLVVPYDDIQALRNVIELLQENADMRLEAGQNARKAFEREYNWPKMESRLLRLYDEVCK